MTSTSPAAAALNTASQEGADYIVNEAPVLAKYHDQVLRLSESWSTASICAVVAEGDVRCFDNDQEAKAGLSDVPAPSAAISADASDPLDVPLPLGPAEPVLDDNAGEGVLATSIVTAPPVEVATLDCAPGWACPGSPSVLYSCSSGWFCVFQDSFGQGRRLQFHDKGNHNLSEYGFRDATSSVMNNMPAGYWGDIIDFRNGMPDPYLVWRWATGTEQLSKEKYRGGSSNWNDRADRVRIRIN
jgi:hypothetical protein